MRNRIAWGLLVALANTLCAHASAQMSPEAVEALQAPRKVERETALTSVPLKKRMSKLAIDATLNGVTREFIFDTGSPTMISKAFARELGVRIIGSNTGRDANGRQVTTQIALVDRLAIGGVIFRAVPVLVADFSVSDPKGCFIKDGLIGSEIFPGSVWRIDLDRSQLHIAERAENLAEISQTRASVDAPLRNWGYPHAPVLPYAIGDFQDSALFDTGHSASVVLFDRVIDNEAVQRALVATSLKRGRGSLGVSAAGLGEETDLLRFEIEGMRVGDDALGRRKGTIRKAPPSLLGLGVLDTHAVTLDYVKGRFRLHPRTTPQPQRDGPGFGLMSSERGIRVMQLYEGSAADRAGLQLGDQVVAIDERELPMGDVPCEVTRWLVENRPASSARRLTVLREGRRVEIIFVKPGDDFRAP